MKWLCNISVDVQGAVHVESEVNKKKSLNSAGHPLLQATLAADSIMHSDDRPNCGGHVALWVTYTSVLEREREYEGLKKKGSWLFLRANSSAFSYLNLPVISLQTLKIA